MNNKVQVKVDFRTEIGKIWDMRIWAQKNCETFLSDDIINDSDRDMIANGITTEFVFGDGGDATMFALRWLGK